MATSTSRASLRKPQRGSGINTDDKVDYIKDYNENLEKLDDYIHLFPCTSITNPVSPFQGMMILEEDTNIVKIWSGTAWVIISNYNNPKGLVAIIQQTKDFATFGSTASLFWQGSFTIEANRRYVLEVEIQANCSSPNNYAYQANAVYAAGGIENLAVNTNLINTQGVYLEAGGGGNVSIFAAPNYWGNAYKLFWVLALGAVSGQISVAVQLQGFTVGVSHSLSNTLIAGEYLQNLYVRDLGAV